MDPTHWRDALAPHIAGRDWIVAADLVIATLGLARALRDLGAARVLCVGVARGTGSLPEEDGFEQLAMDLPLPPDIMGSIRASEHLLCNPPPEIQAAVDAFDPEKKAKVVGTFLNQGQPQLGRPLFGGRKPEWIRLEDKVVIGEALRAAGLPMAPERVVPARRDALLEAAAALDRGEGTVWAGDAREGFNGGASLSFWVRDEADIDPAAATLEAHCDQARVMPFLEGIPCSIHGFVTPEGVAVFRPCEMIVLRRPAHPRFFYSQAATSWDPSAEGRAQMRAAARTLGLWLRENVDFRGVFTIDGVMSAGGFLPTEVNPRYGAALMVQCRALDEVPMLLLHFAAIEGLPIPWLPEALEAVVLESADLNRQLSFMALSKRPSAETRGFGLVLDPDRGWRRAAEDEEPHADVLMGPSPMGTFLRCVLRQEHIRIGAPAAPVAAVVLEMLDRELDLGLGPLEPARER